MRAVKVQGAALVFAAAAVLLLGASPAKAINPVSWAFTESTTGGNISWTSPTLIDPGWAQYDYDYEITSVRVRTSVIWWNLTSLIPADARSGSGSEAGPLPIYLADEDFIYPEPPDTAALSAHVVIYVDGDGYGRAEATSIVLGEYLGVGIDELEFSGTIDVAGVPEPATLALLFLGSLALSRFSRKRRRSSVKT